MRKRKKKHVSALKVLMDKGCIAVYDELIVVCTCGAEYGYTCRVTEKTDVYSFGVVLMELVTGKRPVELEFGENKDIVGWVLSAIRSGQSVSSLVDSQILDPCNKEDAATVLQIAIICTARLPAMRPTMRAVVQMLEEIAQASPVRPNSADNSR